MQTFAAGDVPVLEPPLRVDGAEHVLGLDLVGDRTPGEARYLALLVLLPDIQREEHLLGDGADDQYFPLRGPTSELLGVRVDCHAVDVTFLS